MNITSGSSAMAGSSTTAGTNKNNKNNSNDPECRLEYVVSATAFYFVQCTLLF